MCVWCLLYTYSVYNVPTVNQRKYFTCQESSNFKGISGTKILSALRKQVKSCVLKPCALIHVRLDN